MWLLNLQGKKLDVVEFYTCMSWEALKWLYLNYTNVTHGSIQMMGSFKALYVLHMIGCTKLKMLPTSIGNLSHLSELDLSSCISLSCLPKTIGNIKLSLQRLGLYGCMRLKTLPNSIGDLKLLTMLNFSGCESL